MFGSAVLDIGIGLIFVSVNLIQHPPAGMAKGDRLAVHVGRAQ